MNTSVNLQGKVALVTGGGRGIGKAITQRLAAAGANVVIASRKQDSCDDAAAEIAKTTGRRVIGRACHVGRWKDLEALADAATGRHARAPEIAALRARLEVVFGEYGGPVLVEEFLPGDEFTVGLVDGEVVGVMQVVPRRKDEAFIYSLEVKRDYLNRVDYRAADAPDVAGRDVVIVDDIIDEGRTLEAVLSLLERVGPRSLRVAVLVSKLARRAVPVDIDYIGFEVDDGWVVGLGMYLDGAYRELDHIAIAAPVPSPEELA